MKFLYKHDTPPALIGKVSAFHANNQPALVQLPNNPDFWVAVFDDVEDLKKWAEFCGIDDLRIKRIDDSLDFVNSLEENNIRVMLNPRTEMTPQGPKTRWTEVCTEGKWEKLNGQNS